MRKAVVGGERSVDRVTSPPPKAVEAPPFGAGENCLFVNDGSPLPSPRLEIRGAPGSALVRLAPGELTDGPWCPSDDANNRFDADLFRVRRIGVTIRVQSALAALRGPAGVLFTHGGTSRGGSRGCRSEVHLGDARRTRTWIALGAPAATTSRGRRRIRARGRRRSRWGGAPRGVGRVGRGRAGGQLGTQRGRRHDHRHVR